MGRRRLMQRLSNRVINTATMLITAIFFFGCANVDLVSIDYRPPDPVNDFLPPVPGQSGEILTLQVLGRSLKMKWNRADDPGSVPERLQYLAVMSTANDIDGLSNALANGTIIMDWTENVDFCLVTNLEPWTDYYFNVLVRDEWGNESNYAMKMRKTADSNDNYLPDPSFEATPWTAGVGNACWNIHWITSGSGVQHQTGASHIRTGSRGIYTYTDMMSSLENSQDWTIMIPHGNPGKSAFPGTRANPRGPGSGIKSGRS